MINLPHVPEISSAELASALETGDPIQVVDVRAPQRVQAGRIDLAPEDRFYNIVGSQLIRHTNLAPSGIDPAVPVAVVCGFGNDSRVLAYHLNRLGCDAKSLAGGMSAWMRLAVPRELAPPQSLDYLVQFDRLGKGALGYLLVSGGAALIIDPPRDVSDYLIVLEDTGAKLVGVADTHIHADYISGAAALARQFGVPYYLHPADAVYPYDGTPGNIGFEPLGDDYVIELGRCSLRVKHTPGHTEGSVTYLIDDAAAFTGDFLFIASIGRPDLAGKTAQWSEQLWRSVESIKGNWPPGIMIHPAHYASDHERCGDRSIGEPLGKLLTENAALALADRSGFVEWVTGRSSSFPENYRKIKAVNVGLLHVDEAQAEELEIGKNECALGGAA
jgi:glyoxylase-like metal-dependent hydrolase (beta-lactamase superfamily II)